MVMVRSLPLLPAEAVDEVWSQLCTGRRDDDAVIGTLLVAAIEQCEDHVRRILIERECRETRVVARDWIALSGRPATQILGIDRLEPGGLLTPLGSGDWISERVGHGQMHLRLIGPGGTMRVRYRAGAYPDWSALSPRLRTGIVKLAAHWHGDQGEEGGIPAAVTALWRGERSMGL